MKKSIVNKKAGQTNKKTKIDSWLRQAVKTFHADDHDASKKYCEKILKHDPHNADACHLIGLGYLKAGDLTAALAMIESAIQIDSGFAPYYLSKGRILRTLKRNDDALLSYKTAVSLNPEDEKALYETGALHQQLGDLEAAERYYLYCLRNKANMSECYNNLGLIHKTRRNFSEAVDHLKKAIQINPSLLPAYNNLGIAYKESGDLVSALQAFAAAIRIDSQYVEAYYNMAIVLDEIGRFQEAISCYRHVLRINPSLIDVYNNLGTSLEKIGKTEEALDCLKMAMQLQPENANAFLNAGIIYYHKNELRGAIEFTRQAMRMNKSNSQGRFNLFEQLRAACCWDEMITVEQTIDKFTDQALKSGTKPDESPFVAITRSDNRHRNMKIAARWSREVGNRACRLAPQPYRHPVQPKEKMTIGFLSNRFRNAATGHLMASMFELFDQNRFDIHCYSWGEDDGSYFRNKIEKGCGRFIDISDSGFADIADVIHSNGVDILFDLKGFSRNHKMEVCAMRPAPIQVAYMNFNSTSGADFYDYIIGDPIVTPESHYTEYSEKIIVMPHTFMVTDQTFLAAGCKKTERAAEGLPESGIVFCSLNQSYKIQPDTFKLWMSILQRVKDSVLWLLHDNDLAVENLKAYAKRQGVNPQRLVFAEKVDKASHLSRLQLADIALDTKPCNGHTSTVDALLSGVPVVAMEGEHFVSRVSSSLLHAVGLGTLVANDENEYVAKAVALGKNQQSLARTKTTIANNRRIAPLFDTCRFVRNLENAFEQIWKIYLNDDTPRHIHVKDDGPSMVLSVGSAE